MGRRRGGRRIAERADAAGRPRYLGGERAGTASHEDGEAAAEVLRLERNQAGGAGPPALRRDRAERSEEHTSELQSLMRISYAVFCLKKKKTIQEDRSNIEEYNDNNQNKTRHQIDAKITY